MFTRSEEVGGAKRLGWVGVLSLSPPSSLGWYFHPRIQNKPFYDN